MLEHPDEMRSGQKHLARDARALFVATRIHVVDLDRYVAPVIRVVRQVHDASASTAHLIDDRVLTDLLGDFAGSVLWNSNGHAQRAKAVANDGQDTFAGTQGL